VYDNTSVGGQSVLVYEQFVGVSTYLHTDLSYSLNEAMPFVSCVSPTCQLGEDVEDTGYDIMRVFANRYPRFHRHLPSLCRVRICMLQRSTAG